MLKDFEFNLTLVNKHKEVFCYKDLVSLILN